MRFVFTAAVFVFVGHYSAQRHSGGLFWQVFSHGRTAVLVFFVLSGFVIAWITETKAAPRRIRAKPSRSALLGDPARFPHHGCARCLRECDRSSTIRTG